MSYYKTPIVKYKHAVNAEFAMHELQNQGIEAELSEYNGDLIISVNPESISKAKETIDQLQLDDSVSSSPNSHLEDYIEWSENQYNPYHYYDQGKIPYWKLGRGHGMAVGSLLIVGGFIGLYLCWHNSDETTLPDQYLAPVISIIIGITILFLNRSKQ